MLTDSLNVNVKFWRSDALVKPELLGYNHLGLIDARCLLATFGLALSLCELADILFKLL